jgi:hypothetical protein
MRTVIAWTLLLCALPVGAQFNGDLFQLTAQNNPQLEIAPVGTISLTAGLGSIGNGKTINLTPGSYALDKAPLGVAVDTVYIIGSGSWVTTLTGSDSLILPPDSATHVFFEDLSIVTTGLGNALGRGNYHFKDCVVKARFLEARDSIWGERTVFEGTGTGADSMCFSSYSDLLKCDQRGIMWTFGRSNSITVPVTAWLRECNGFSTTTSCLHVPDENRNTTVYVMGGYYETTANAYVMGAANEANVDISGATLKTWTTTAGVGNAAFYAHDSVKASLYGSNFISAWQSNDLTLAFYSVYIQTCDTVRVEGNFGNNVCSIDSSADPNISPPIMLFWRANYFENETITMTNQEFAARVIGPKGNHYVFESLIARDVTLGGEPSDLVLQIMTATGSNARLIYNTYDKLQQELYLAGTAGFLSMDRDGAARTGILRMLNNSGDSTIVAMPDSMYYLEGIELGPR